MPRTSRIPSAPLRIAVDTGGTFTDCLALIDGRLRMTKVFSTPPNPAESIITAVRQFSGDDHAVTLLHGTTVGTNTLLERKGARVAFVTTAGFEDSIEIGRQARPRLYDFFFDRIPPLVPSELRFGITERIGPEGEVIAALDRATLAAVAEKLRRARPDAIALSLLFGFANPAHEV